MHDIIGHDATLRAFERMIAGDRLAHAYLLIGPRGVGKHAVAQWVAARLLCGDNHPPCGTCAACTQVARGIHPDVHHVGGAEALDVGAARAWTDSLAQTSLYSGWRVGILEVGSDLSWEAGNALLKVLEEPPPRTVLLLTAEHVGTVLPTIASRCGIMRLHRVPSDVIADALRARGHADADIAPAVALAEGCPGRALTYITDPNAARAVREETDTAHALLDEAVPLATRLQRAAALFPRAHDADDRAAIRHTSAAVLDACAHHIRQRLRSNPAHAASLVPALAMLTRSRVLLAANVAPRLVLESVLLAYS